MTQYKYGKASALSAMVLPEGVPGTNNPSMTLLNTETAIRAGLFLDAGENRECAIIQLFWLPTFCFFVKESKG